MLFFIILMILVMVVPVALLFVLPIWAAVRLYKRKHSPALWLLPLLVPAATFASEAYPKWLVRGIARAPVGGDAHPEQPQSLYAFNGYAPDAARLAVEFPQLRFTEGLIDEERRSDGSNYRWDRLPVGPVRFAGRRKVAQASDCSGAEVAVVLVPDRGAPVAWYCTGWTAIAAPAATHEVKFDLRNYSIGPFKVFERRDYVVRRATGEPVNTVISASITGGIWWKVTEWFGDVTGMSSLGNGSFVGGYSASTADYLGGVSGYEFMMTGRIGKVSRR